MFRLFYLFILLLTSFFSLEGAAEQEKKLYDKMILSLSWSPTYCLQNAQKRDRMQCEQKQYKAVLHGLWPQSMDSKGRNRLTYCQKPVEEVPAHILETMLPIMPSAGLIQHTWRKHGSCSHLSMESYFDLSQSFYRHFKASSLFFDKKQTTKLSLGEAKETLAKQMSLTEDHFFLTCRGRMLSEIRICLTDAGKARACLPQERKRQCRLQNLYIPILL